MPVKVTFALVLPFLWSPMRGGEDRHATDGGVWPQQNCSQALGCPERGPIWTQAIPVEVIFELPLFHAFASPCDVVQATIHDSEFL